MSGLWSTVAGIGDFAAGSIDESIARGIDNKPGGGPTQGFFQTLGSLGQGAANVAAGTADFAAGSVDEAIGGFGKWIKWGVLLLGGLVVARMLGVLPA